MYSISHGVLFETVVYLKTYASNLKTYISSSDVV
jgi:hypothetical protein